MKQRMDPLRLQQSRPHRTERPQQCRSHSSQSKSAHRLFCNIPSTSLPSASMSTAQHKASKPQTPPWQGLKASNTPVARRVVSRQGHFSLVPHQLLVCESPHSSQFDREFQTFPSLSRSPSAKRLARSLGTVIGGNEPD